MYTSGLKPSCLTCAVSLVSLSAIAGDFSESNFVKDAKLDGKIQTVYYDDKKDAQDVTSGAWTGALWINAQTGYIADILGFGVSGYGVAKIDMKDGNVGSSDLLDSNNDGFSKLGQAWFELKLPDHYKSDSYKNVSANVKVGRQRVRTGLLTTSGSRSAPSSWQGVDAAVDIGGFHGGIAWVDKVSPRDASDLDNIANDYGEKIDWVVGTELSYTFDLGNKRTLKLQYNNGLAYHYVNANNVNVVYKTPIFHDSTLTLNGLYYFVKKDGDLWRWKNNIAPYKDDAHSWNINAVLNTGPWTFNLGVTQTQAETSARNQQNGYYTIGNYDYYFGVNTQGAYNTPSNAIYSSFNFHKETVWGAGIGYDFSSIGIEGLSVSYNYFYGSGMKAKEVATGIEKDVYESEGDLALVYKFPQQPLKGLKLVVKYVDYNNSTAFYKATDQSDAKCLRTWLSYEFSL